MKLNAPRNTAWSFAPSSLIRLLYTVLWHRLSLPLQHPRKILRHLKSAANQGTELWTAVLQQQAAHNIKQGKPLDGLQHKTSIRGPTVCPCVARAHTLHGEEMLPDTRNTFVCRQYLAVSIHHTDKYVNRYITFNKLPQRPVLSCNPAPSVSIKEVNVAHVSK
jgi:hypothetical protein